MNTIIHFVVMLEAKEPVIAQMEGAVPNAKPKGSAVTPVKATAGTQRFACDKADMRKHAGKQYEGAWHAASGEPQFVNCPFCKETEAHKKALEEHERYAAEDKGLFSGILNGAGTGVFGGTSRPVDSARASDAAAKAGDSGPGVQTGDEGPAVPAADKQGDAAGVV